MLKAVAESGDTGEPVILLGISKMNVEKLQEGLPIRVDLRELGLVGEVLLFYGETEEIMYASFKKAGVDIKHFIDHRHKG